jgi:hypothetical protein
VPTKLTGVRIIKLALVARPANRRPILLLKSEDAMPGDAKADLTLKVDESMVAVLKSAVEPAKDEDAILADVLKADMSDEDKNKVRMALRALSTVKGLPEAALKALATAAGSDYAAGVSKAEHEAAMRKAVDEAVAKALADAKLQPAAERKIIKTADGVEIDLATIPEAQRPAFEALAKSAEAVQKKLEQELNERKRRDLIEKSRKDYPNLAADKVASILLKSEGDLAKEVEEVLKQAEAMAAKGRAFDEIGSDASGAGGDAWAKIEAGAKQLVQKSAGKLTQAAAVSEFLRTEEGQALHRQYRADLSG